MTYRGPDDSPAARYAEARRRHEEALTRVERKRRDAALLASDERNLGVVSDWSALGDLPRLNVSAADPSALPPAALVTMTSEVDFATSLVLERERRIDEITASFEARARGASQALCPAPRSVPPSYLAAELLSLPFAVTMFAIAIFGGGLTSAGAPAVTSLALVVLGAAIHFAMAARRVSLLARGDVPVSFTVAHEDSIGSYENTRMNDAHGWDIVPTQYSGPIVKNRIRYVTADGGSGEIVRRGMAFSDGALLCKPRGGGAMVVTDFACSPRPDPRGAWSGALTTPRKVIVALALAASVGALTVSAVELVPTGHQPGRRHGR